MFADVLSVLSMTMGRPGKRDVLQYKFLGNLSDIGDWGSEYVRSLSSELGAEFDERLQKDMTSDVSDLIGIVKTVIPFNMRHNAEVDVC